MLLKILLKLKPGLPLMHLRLELRKLMHMELQKLMHMELQKLMHVELQKLMHLRKLMQLHLDVQKLMMTPMTQGILWTPCAMGKRFIL